MNFIDPQIEQYAINASSPESELLARISRETFLKTYMPRMLSGHLQGRILSMFSKMLAPKLIVEVGTFTGYSAICLAEGLAENGRLITIDINEELKPKVVPYFEEAGFGNKIEMRCGDAAQLLKEIPDGVDLVFLDADKENYLLYWNILFPKLRSGGILIADNVLWSGKVLEKESTDPETVGLKAFTQAVAAEKNSEQVLIPVRDGLLVVRKK
ncbi:MAG TPA: O-methyltransferase [Bacteroidia bacterium]|jgi:predicted O-methyltransferase YrrM|nr:O-methyltransferase [Bacteroidia bacterium]